MVRIAIEYCAPCRLGAEAVATQRVLSDHLRDYEEIDGVTLDPSGEEVFCVHVDDEPVWSVDPESRVDPMEAVAAVRSRLAV